MTNPANFCQASIYSQKRMLLSASDYMGIWMLDENCFRLHETPDPNFIEFPITKSIGSWLTLASD